MIINRATYVRIDFFGEQFKLFGGQLLEQVIHIDVIVLVLQLGRRHIVHNFSVSLSEEKNKSDTNKLDIKQQTLKIG